MAAPQFDPNSAYAVPAFDPSADFQSAGGGQGSSPNYGAGVTTVNPTLGQIGMGAAREGAQLASGAYGFGRGTLDLIPGVKNSQFGQQMQQNQQQLDNAAQPQNVGEAMGKTGAQIGSYLLPAKAESALADLAPEELKFLARIGASSLSSGSMNALNGGSFATGAATGAGVGTLSEGARAFLAPALVRSAIPGGISKDSANAFLSETRGFKPSVALNSTKDAITQAGAERDAAIAANPNAQVNLSPAAQTLQDAWMKSANKRVPDDMKAIEDMMDFLRGTGQYGPVRGASVPADEALTAKQGFNDNFLGNRAWKQLVNSDPQSAAKQAYGQIAEALHQAVPGSQEADELMSKLIPVQRGLKALDRNDPSVVANVMQRVAAKTGGLTGAAIGAASGASGAGLPGAIVGGATGLLGPEVASAPTSKLAIARLLYSTAPPKAGRAVLTPAIDHLMEMIRTSGTNSQGQ